MDEISTIGATFYRILSGTIGVTLFGLFGNKIHGWMTPFKNDIKTISFIVMSVTIVMFGGFWLLLVAIKYVNIGIASVLMQQNLYSYCLLHILL